MNPTEDRRVERLDAFVINLEGDFDLCDREGLAAALTATHDSNIVVVNAEKLGYFGSTVLNWLVALERATGKRGGQLILVGVAPAARRILKISQLEPVFDIRNSLYELTMALIGSARIRTLTLSSA